MPIDVPVSLPEPEPDDEPLLQDRTGATVLVFSRDGVRRGALWTTIALVACTAAGFGGWWWPCELFSHFRAQYAALLTVAALGWPLMRRPRVAALAAAGAAVNILLIAPLYWDESLAASPASAPPAAVYRAVSLNVDVQGHAYAAVARWLQAADPDLLLLIEVDARWIPVLEPLRARYPCREEILAEAGRGIAFYSRLPCASVEAVPHPVPGCASILARLDVPEGPLTVVATHPRTPVTPEKMAARNRQLAEVAGLVRRQSGPLMLMGDLNITSWSPAFGRLLRETGLRDSRLGLGLQPSWPTFWPWASIPIDHALLSPEIVLHRRELGPVVGSDHRPVIMEFSISPRRDRT